MRKTWGAPSDVDIPVAYACVEKAKEELDWRPQYNIHQGLKKTLEYYKMQDNEY